MSSTETITQQFDVDSAPEFLHAIMPTSNIWGSVSLNQHVFRGHADATWPLLPTALRSPADTSGTQRTRELVALRNFWLEADRQGLAIPGDEHEIRELWISPVAPAVLGSETLRLAGRTEWADQIRQWPPPNLWQALALAQHYGVATRLLDWSRLPTVAAYFAARDAAELIELGTAPDRLAIWACHENILHVGRWLEPSEQYVHFVVVPRAGNPNLHAQHGVFTLVTMSGTGAEGPDRDPVDCTPLDKALGAAMLACRRGQGNLFTHLTVEAGPSLRKITLPVAQAPRLLELLDMLGISGGTLLTGFGGAAQGANERSMRKRLLTDR